ncbi:uncharacterized protein BT62DRAFT_1008682 [Guyanagaster necrorhizus]|uniref:Uncharacterized protein n=1 Tax=Guyanagaster necrorhizus TaxID=856835 RepID=A0A9P7VMM7_9AGAR|nr:uncharacterized protein BT62DRAFT_1008682 [Guyanagaster necrorhizus MCA 3950]KAG7443998.1 hypothetical protein BT62DRAFT_1008682 [Guyanagaster necrorhizus MCA 3950]
MYLKSSMISHRFPFDIDGHCSRWILVLGNNIALWMLMLSCTKDDLKDLKFTEGISCTSSYAYRITEDILQFLMKSFWTVRKVKEPEKKIAEVTNKMGYTDDDFTNAFASPPDENDPGAFENKPDPDDDLSTHMQVPFPRE